mmetsp:Transcript_27367/g.24131  ORF Transcript_27367/g.24131 Transcript_27367/m.24131 type:complete len:124 (-) Transcript_27367:111-482(-)
MGMDEILKHFKSLDKDENPKNLQFSRAEDKELIARIKKYDRCWKRIAQHFEGRTIPMLKNRFYYLCKKGVIDRDTYVWNFGEGRYEANDGFEDDGVNMKRKIDNMDMSSSEDRSTNFEKKIKV